MTYITKSKTILTQKTNSTSILPELFKVNLQNKKPKLMVRVNFLPHFLWKFPIMENREENKFSIHIIFKNYEPFKFKILRKEDNHVSKTLHVLVCNIWQIYHHTKRWNTPIVLLYHIVQVCMYIECTYSHIWQNLQVFRNYCSILFSCTLMICFSADNFRVHMLRAIVLYTKSSKQIHARMHIEHEYTTIKNACNQTNRLPPIVLCSTSIIIACVKNWWIK